MSKIGPAGVGPIVFGMTPSKAASTGTHLTRPNSAIPDDSCYYLHPSPELGIDFMVVQGTLRRVDVRTPAMQTVDGFRVGDSVAKVREFYGTRAQVFPAKYDPGAQVIEVAPRGADAAKFRTVFSGKNGVVREIIAGALPQVLWVERCG